MSECRGNNEQKKERKLTDHVYQNQKAEAHYLRVLPPRVFDSIRYHETVLVAKSPQELQITRNTSIVVTDDAIFEIELGKKIEKPPMLLIDVTRFEVSNEGASWLVQKMALRSQKISISAKKYSGTR